METVYKKLSDLATAINIAPTSDCSLTLNALSSPATTNAIQELSLQCEKRLRKTPEHYRKVEATPPGAGYRE
jgi:hypothetical protein